MFKPYNSPFSRNLFLWGAGCAVGCIFLGSFLSCYFLNQSERSSIMVHGFAEEIIKSDSGVLSFKIMVYGDTLPSVDKNSIENIKKTKRFLIHHGFKESEIKIQNETMYDEGGKKDPKKCYVVSVEFHIQTHQVDLLEALAGKIYTLAEHNIFVDNDSTELRFFCSKIVEKHPDLLKKGAEHTKIAAQNLAQEMNVPLGNLHYMHEGFVEVLHPDTDNKDELCSLYKKLRITFNSSWFIRSVAAKESINAKGQLQ